MGLGERQADGVLSHQVDRRRLDAGCARVAHPRQIGLGIAPYELEPPHRIGGLLVLAQRMMRLDEPGERKRIIRHGLQRACEGIGRQLRTLLIEIREAKPRPHQRREGRRIVVIGPLFQFFGRRLRQERDAVDGIALEQREKPAQLQVLNVELPLQRRVAIFVEIGFERGVVTALVAASTLFLPICAMASV